MTRKPEPPYPQKPLQIGRHRVTVKFRFTYPVHPEGGFATDADWVAVVDDGESCGGREMQMDLDAVRRARDWFERAAACIAYRNAKRRRERRAKLRRMANRKAEP